jgi:hypothetical protein
MTSTFSWDRFPENKDELRLGNKWVPQYMTLPISDSFKHNLEINRTNMK